jgi:hypothetical protein
VSLRFRHGERDLHYGFVVALLNDLFGIQARGGCSCAGPYGHALLGLTRTTSRALDAAVAAGENALRPGWVRLNFNYFIDDDEFDYLLGALELVARHGWRLLPAYRLDRRAGLWRHRDSVATPPVSLFAMDPLTTPAPEARHGKPDFAALLADARTVLLSGPDDAPVDDTEADAAPWSDDWERLRWFVLGREAIAHDRDTGRVPASAKAPA